MTGKGKIISDYGMSEYYEYYLENNDHFISRRDFNNIVSEFNSGIVDLIINDRLEFVPPKLDMTLCIRKIKKEIRIEDDKVVNTAPIDWKETKKLWEINETARENKTLIRFLNTHTAKNVFRIKFLKNGNNFKNRNKYKFKAVRGFARSLATRIFDKTKPAFDAFNLY